MIPSTGIHARVSGCTRSAALVVLATLALLAGAFVPLQLGAAEQSGSGTIEGRVLNEDTGDYILNARVSIPGTTLEALTNSFGEYRITGVPVGETTVKFSYIGQQEQSKAVTVSTDAVATADFSISASSRSGVLNLEKYVVTTTRESDSRAIAINEQRHSANLKNVISTDEFGAVTEGNVGEFAKYIPGVNVDYNAADARTISVRGLPSNNTPVTIDGFPVASAASSSATRTFELEQVSINNTSRLELSKVPTPDVSASALGGAINLVSKSAFERSRPLFSYRAYTSMNSNAKTLSKTPGPGRSPSRKVTPGFDFTYINPVTKNFGFAINALYSEQYNSQFRSQMQWAPTGIGVANITPENPYLARWLIQDAPKFTTRYSVGTKLDWRIAANDVLSFGVQYNDYDGDFGGSNIQWDVGSTPTFGPNFTQGRNNAGNVTIGTNFRHKFGNTVTPTLSYTHTGPVWKINAGLSYSRSENHYRDMRDGFFENVTFRIASQTVRFENINEVRPGTVTNPVDHSKLANYRVLTARSSENDSTDVVRSVYANIARDLKAAVPITFKAGFDIRENERDIRYPQKVYTYLGPDGVANSADDTAGAYVDDTRVSQRPPYGLNPVEWPSTYKMLEAFRANPSWFRLNEVGAPNTGSIATERANSQNITERISAGFVRLDTRLLNGKLWLVGGVRFERTDDDGYGLLNDPGAIYQRNADGSYVLNGSGNRILITADPLAQARLIYTERGTHVKKSYEDFYPSLNAAYNITDDLILRFGFAQTIGRPDYRFIIPGTRIVEPSASVPNGSITINNTGLMPWKSDSFDLALEYYIKPSGVASIGLFRKNFSDFFGRVVSSVSDETLEGTGLDPDQYLGYDVVSMSNVGDARVDGLEVSYSQKLEFLPEWARGTSVFANGTFLKLEGANAADFSNFVSRQLNWGLRYDSSRFSANVKWNFRGRQKGALQAAANIPPDTYEYVKERLQIDLDFTYNATKWISFFVAARNVTNDHLVFQRYAPTTPAVARTFRDEDYGAQWTFGVRGRF